MILTLLACGSADRADDVCAFERLPDPLEARAWTIGTRVPYAAGEVHVEARWPDGAGDWPVALVLHGGWAAAGTPVEDTSAHLSPGEGVVSIHLDLPGTGRTDGDNDRRGAGSRAAVAAALAWAAGTTRDLGGCTLAERIPDADPGRLLLVGASNGGNLAVATLADPELSLPDVAGLVLWETPAGPQFAGVELGASPTVYEPGSCSFAAATGVVCGFPEELLVAGTRAEEPVLCFDLDGDGECGDADVVVPGVEDPISGRQMVSPILAQAAADAGLLPDGWGDATTAADWWEWRDAGRLAAGLVGARPELPVLLVASEEDHVQTLADHPHVFGLGEALQAATVSWLRLNPGRDWLGAARGENEPNAPLRLVDPDGRLLTEDEEAPLEQALSAAVRELADRRSSGDW